MYDISIIDEKEERDDPESQNDYVGKANENANINANKTVYNTK